MKKALFIITAIIIFLVLGCKTMVQDHCSENGAALAGVNDAKNNKPVDNNFGEFCPGNKVQLSAVYHHAYLVTVLSEKHTFTLKSQNGSQASGQSCLEFGDNKACGYHCMKSIKMVKCASTPKDNCAGDNSGNIKCGVNCRLEQGHLKCDQER